MSKKRKIEMTADDKENFIKLIGFYNKQSKNCFTLYENFMLLYDKKFENKESSIEEVSILVFLIDYICVTRLVTILFLLQHGIIHLILFKIII
jgi:hypothetical protein